MPARLRVTKRELERLLPELDASPLPTEVKSVLRELLIRANNPNSDRVDVVVASLEEKRQRAVKDVRNDVAARTRSVLSRAREGLLAMSDQEWNELVEEADGVDETA